MDERKQKSNQRSGATFVSKTHEDVHEIRGWPTDVASIDYYCKSRKAQFPHTVFMFVPGIPGCITWYMGMLESIISNLGVGYAARAVSYAGHGVGDKMVGSDINEDEESYVVSTWAKNSLGNKQRGRRREKQSKNNQKATLKSVGSDSKSTKASIAFTVDGQVEHKIEWVDLIISEMIALRNGTEENKTKAIPKFIFLTHSTGAHLVQRMLVLRRDFLFQTELIIHLTPFYRYSPSSMKAKLFLSTCANIPQECITFFKFLARLGSKIPPKVIDSYLEKVQKIPKEKDRKYVRELYLQPAYARNFLALGLEEVRDVPELHDEAAMKIIGNVCPMSILYCKKDTWAPYEHMETIAQAQKAKRLPKSICLEYNSNVLHKFIVIPDMIPLVVDFVLRSVTSAKAGGMRKIMQRSKL